MSQIEKLEKLLSDGRPHRTDEILRVVYGDAHLGLARVGARVWDLKRKGLAIHSWKDDSGEANALWWYQLQSGVRRPESGVKSQGQEQNAGGTPALQLFENGPAESASLRAMGGR